MGSGPGFCTSFDRDSGKREIIEFWRLKYRLKGKGNAFAIGRYPEVTLAQAREEKIAAGNIIRPRFGPKHERDKVTRREKECSAKKNN
ncbi:MAG: hypothetical protein DRR06_05195 [Gammaproteobacteria bacterium]|nr:MAG: hypothetical protein DRR42_18920 [Gammaproteobacteria bacterium]RLA46386.1 MAG: hypothetical protein DRR06_05195 [Gammaproteobacteria bacterium]